MKLQRLVQFLAIGAVALVVAVGAVRLYAAVNVPWPGATTAIPDNGSLNTTLVVDNTTVSNPGAVAPPWSITDLNVRFSATHTWDDDVLIRIASPAVAAVTLMQNCGGSGDNFTNTIIDDEGAAFPTANCHSSASAPFTTTIQALQGGGPASQPPAINATALAAFDGTDAFGTWTLTASDDSAVCVGSLVAWSLTLDGPNPLPVELMKFEVK